VCVRISASLGASGGGSQSIAVAAGVGGTLAFLFVIMAVVVVPVWQPTIRVIFRTAAPAAPAAPALRAPHYAPAAAGAGVDAPLLTQDDHWQPQADSRGPGQAGSGHPGERGPAPAD
jgi:hypothetical protein